jgi:Domain of unknown function (DUF4928)
MKNDSLKRARQVMEVWYEQLPKHKSTGGAARGTIAAGLVILEHLKETFDLDLKAHRAAGGSQLKGAGGAALGKILAKFGETRQFLKEGGRTNRGGPGDIDRMLKAVESLGLESYSSQDRVKVIEELQKFLVEKVQEYHSRQRLKFSFIASQSVFQTVADLLGVARMNGKEGPVAQYLVGAKLQLRFPELKIGNESYSTADDQLGRRGDFLIGDTVFHVTVAPMIGLFAKCRQNVADGMRVYLLVPERALMGARQIAEQELPGQLTVTSIESFVSQNIEELSTFSQDKLIPGMFRLFSLYNERVDGVEIDKSMLLEIPDNLIPKHGGSS